MRREKKLKFSHRKVVVKPSLLREVPNILCRSIDGLSQDCRPSICMSPFLFDTWNDNYNTTFWIVEKDEETVRGIQNIHTLNIVLVINVLRSWRMDWYKTSYKWTMSAEFFTEVATGHQRPATLGTSTWTAQEAIYRLRSGKGTETSAIQLKANFIYIFGGTISLQAHLCENEQKGRLSLMELKTLDSMQGGENRNSVCWARRSKA